MSSKATKKAATWVLVLIALVGTFSALWVYRGYLPGVPATIGPPPGYTGQQAQPGYAYCASTGTIAPATSPPPGCYNIARKIGLHLYDFYAGSSIASWSCKFWALVGGSWAFQESVTNTGSDGICTTAGSYLPGTAMMVQACDSTSACAAADYAQQKTVYFAALPSENPNGIGSGTVGFSPIPATTTPTASVNFPVIKLTGDAYATNTPNTITIAWFNGTTFGTSNTGFTTSGPDAIGTKFDLHFTIQIGTSGTEPADPYGAGYKSFIPVDLQSGPSALGTLVGGLHMVITATTGTNMVVPINTPFRLTFSNSATKQTYFYTLGDEQQTLAKDGAGQIIVPGGVKFAGSFDASALSGTDVVTLAFDWYAYYSVNYFTSFGTVNSQAVKVSGTNTVTIKV